MRPVDTKYSSVSRRSRCLGVLGICLLLSACATTHSESETTPVIAIQPTPAETAAPDSAGKKNKQDSKESSKTKKAGSADPWPPTPKGVTVIDPAQVNQELQKHRLALQQRSDIALPPAEVGYYVDNMQARFIQKLRSPGVTFARKNDVLTIRISGVQTFETNSFRLEAEMKNELAPLGEILVEYDKTLIQIAGHTDDSGPDEYNQKLSEQRALTLTRILIEAGVNPQRIAAIGFGESQPLQPNTNEAAKLGNRRLELRIEPVIASGN